jgi:hypothetical protein
LFHLVRLRFTTWTGLKVEDFPNAFAGKDMMTAAAPPAVKSKVSEHGTKVIERNVGIRGSVTNTLPELIMLTHRVQRGDKDQSRAGGITEKIEPKRSISTSQNPAGGVATERMEGCTRWRAEVA